MTGPGGDADDLGRLQRRIDYLESELERVGRSTATSGVLAAGAAMVVMSLALPWSVAVGDAEFDESATIGWSAFGSDPLGLAVGLVLMLVVGLAAAASVSRSPQVSLAAHIAATWVCGVPLLLLLWYGLARAEVNRPAVGYYTALIAVAAVAITAAVRRSQLRTD